MRQNFHQLNAEQARHTRRRGDESRNDSPSLELHVYPAHGWQVVVASAQVGRRGHEVKRMCVIACVMPLTKEEKINIPEAITAQLS